MSRRWSAVGLTVAAIASAGLGSCSSSGDRAGTPDPSSAASTSSTPNVTRAPRLAGESDGAYVFRTRCAGCHGQGGEGNVGPSLVGIASLMSADAEAAIIRNGKGSMVPFEGRLTDAEIAAVVEYTRTQLG